MNLHSLQSAGFSTGTGEAPFPPGAPAVGAGPRAFPCALSLGMPSRYRPKRRKSKVSSAQHVCMKTCFIEKNATHYTSQMPPHLCRTRLEGLHPPPPPRTHIPMNFGQVLPKAGSLCLEEPAQSPGDTRALFLTRQKFTLRPGPPTLHLRGCPL